MFLVLRLKQSYLTGLWDLQGAVEWVTWCLTTGDGHCGSRIVWSWGCNNESEMRMSHCVEIFVNKQVKVSE